MKESPIRSYAMAARPATLFYSIYSIYRLMIFCTVFLVFGLVQTVQGTGDAVYAILGNTGIITCPGYDKVRLNNSQSGANISDVYSLRFFKNTRATDYIVFTFLDMPPHRIQMPQNEWKDRNISFSLQDQPQIRLPNVTFRDDATYICDLTPASRNTPVISETRLRVVACPDNVEVTIVNSTTADLSIGGGNKSTPTPASMYPLSSSTPTFQRGTGIQVRCTTVSYPAATLSLSIPGLNLDTPEWQNLTESAGDHGYTLRSLDAYFTLDGQDVSLFQGALTVDCHSSVANGTCTNTNSLAIQVFVPQTTTKATTSTVSPTTVSTSTGAGLQTTVTESLRGSGTTVTADGTVVVAAALTGGQIAGIVIGCLAGVLLISAVIYVAVKHKNKDISCKKPQGYSVTGMGVNGKSQQHHRRDISHPKAITAYPQHPCPKTGSVTFVDASALL